MDFNFSRYIFINFVNLSNDLPSQNISLQIRLDISYDQSKRFLRFVWMAHHFGWYTNLSITWHLTVKLNIDIYVTLQLVMFCTKTNTNICITLNLMWNKLFMKIKLNFRKGHDTTKSCIRVSSRKGIQPVTKNKMHILCY